jgi:hypothetical protein
MAATIKRRFNARSGMRHFMLGFAAPALLAGTVLELRPLARGESLTHAWRSTGNNLREALRRVEDETETTGPRS